MNRTEYCENFVSDYDETLENLKDAKIDCYNKDMKEFIETTIKDFIYKYEREYVECQQELEEESNKEKRYMNLEYEKSV